MTEAGLWFVTAGSAGWLGIGAMQARAARQQADAIIVKDHPAAGDTRAGQPIGRLDIKAIGLSVPLLEDYDNVTLRRGVGHVPGTAFPGGLGNLVLAGHRDTFFRPLRGVHGGMPALVTAPTGHWLYEIDRTEVVTPDQVEVLDIGDRPEMTLITCFPFNYIGAAPQRFIVHAHLISVDPSYALSRSR